MASPKQPAKRAGKRAVAKTRRLSPRGFVRTTVMLTPDQLSWLQSYADERMTPASYVLRSIIDNFRMDADSASQPGTRRTTAAKIRP